MVGRIITFFVIHNAYYENCENRVIPTSQNNSSNSEDTDRTQLMK